MSLDLNNLQNQLNTQNAGLPPVEKWNPDFCGDIDIQIKHDGSWFYMGSPIGRAALVKLFASVLKCEDEQYFLVTPVEKVGIKVDDVPFLITQWRHQEKRLILTTNTQDDVFVSAQNPIKLAADKITGAILPYVLVRRNLWARLHQNVFYQLAELGHEQLIEGKANLTLKSDQYTFSLGEL